MESDIRSLRLQRNVPQRDLARLAGIPLQDLSKCERGLIVPPPRFFDSIARALDVCPESLYKTHVQLLKQATPGEGYSTAQVEKTFVTRRLEEPAHGRAKVLDLFCGVGGFSHGFELQRDFQVTAGIDLLPDRIQTFCENHKGANGICSSISEINIDDLLSLADKPDVVIGGPPCQGFSSIRPFRTLTEGDPRNNLFEYFAMVVEAVRPQWFVFENVVGLLSHQGGTSLKAIINLFQQIGYFTEWKVLNAVYYGLPQRRERLIVVGNRCDDKFRWPEPTHYFDGRSMAGAHAQRMEKSSLFSLHLKPALTIMQAIHDLPEISSGESATTYRTDVEPTDYEREMRGYQEVLTLHEATAHSEKMLEIIRLAGSSRAALPPGLTSSGFSTSYSRLEADEPAVTITVNFVHPSSNKCIHPHQHRALTPREGARLQGFEDSFVFRGARAQIVKQIGNAVPPILGRVIAASLVRHL